MGVGIENSQDGMIARISGEIDHHSARHIRERIDSAVEKAKPNKLIIDMESVDFMDSSGIGLIMGRYKLMRLYNGSLEIKGMSERVKRVVSMAGIERLNIFSENAGASR